MLKQQPSTNLKDAAKAIGIDCSQDVSLHARLNYVPLLASLATDPNPQDLEAAFARQKFRVQLFEEWLRIEKVASTSSWEAYLQYMALMLAGTLYFGCEGFDGIIALLGVFSLPAVVMIGTGLLFSLLSIVVFYSFELVEIGKNLGVSAQQPPQLVHGCIEEITLLGKARRYISRAYLTASIEELRQYKKILAYIDTRYATLQEKQKDLTASLDSPMMQTINTLVAAITGLLFFGGGFFAGQTVAMFAMTMMLGAGCASVTALPVIISSILIGCAAYAIYWFVERPGIEVFVSQKFGLDKTAIDAFCAKDLEDKEESTHWLEQAVEQQCYMHSQGLVQKFGLYRAQNQPSKTKGLEETYCSP